MLIDPNWQSDTLAHALATLFPSMDRGALNHLHWRSKARGDCPRLSRIVNLTTWWQPLFDSWFLERQVLAAATMKSTF